MGGMFGGGAPSMPGPDPYIIAQREKEEKRAKEAEDELARRKAEDEEARAAGLRGRRSLLTGSELGYEDSLG